MIDKIQQLYKPSQSIFDLEASHQSLGVDISVYPPSSILYLLVPPK